MINTGLFTTNRSWDIPEEIKYNKQTNTEMNTTTAKPLTYDLVELVIHFDDNNTESMIVSLDSFAHEAVLEYARVNFYQVDSYTITDITKLPLNDYTEKA